MVFIKLLVVLIAIAIGLFLIVKVKKGKGYEETGITFRPGGILAGVGLIIVAFLINGAIGQIPAGYRGVVLQFGAVTSETKGEGLYFITPIVNSVERMDVQTHAYEAEAGAASKDLQDVHTKVTLNYGLDPLKV